jgi:hypothetical protein
MGRLDQFIRLQFQLKNLEFERQDELDLLKRRLKAFGSSRESVGDL